MITTDRADFEIQAKALCAGFNVPATPERIEAFWIGCGKMRLHQFATAVEGALGPESEERKGLPSPGQLWGILRRTRPPAQSVREAEADHLEYFANRLLWQHVAGRGGLGSTGTFKPGYGMTDCKASAELEACLKAKRETVEWFRGPVSEGDADCTPKSFIVAFQQAIAKVSRIDSTVLDAWRKAARGPAASLPLAPAMARALSP